MPSEGDHPHFALLAYLAEVASVTEHLPEQKSEDKSLAEDPAHGGIEDILTAAAMAESLKEELFAKIEGGVTPEEENEPEDEELVPPETVPGEAVVEEAFMEEPNTAMPEPEQEEKTGDTQGLTQISQLVTLPQHDEVLDTETPVSPSIPHSPQELCAIVPAPSIETGATMDDWESLISFSEADETGEFAMDTDAPDSNEGMSLEQLKSTAMFDDEAPDAIVTAGVESCLDEMGEFVPSTITIFEDPCQQEDIPSSSGTRGRESLNNQVIFSLPTEKELTGSPPKRQISSLYDQENVPPMSLDPSDS